MPDDFECKQIFIAHRALWIAMETWAKSHNFDLSLIPTVDADGNLTLDYSKSLEEDKTPTYAFMPRQP